MPRLVRSALALPAIALAVLAATSASAAEGAKPGGGQYVDLAPVALPVVLDNRVINYVFISVRVNLTASANAPRLQAREPYFRDALVRAGHRTPFTRGNDFTALDDAKLKAAMYSAATAIAGAGNVASVTILSETPKSRSGLPRPKASGAR